MKEECIIHTETIDVSLDEVEKLAVEMAKNRLPTELLGVHCAHTKKIGNNRKDREIKYGRGKTIKFDTSSKAWDDYKKGKISVVILKNSKPTKASTIVIRERPEWMKRLELEAKARNIKAQLKNS